MSPMGTATMRATSSTARLIVIVHSPFPARRTRPLPIGPPTPYRVHREPRFSDHSNGKPASTSADEMKAARKPLLKTPYASA